MSRKQVSYYDDEESAHLAVKFDRSGSDGRSGTWAEPVAVLVSGRAHPAPQGVDRAALPSLYELCKVSSGQQKYLRALDCCHEQLRTKYQGPGLLLQH